MAIKQMTVEVAALTQPWQVELYRAMTAGGTRVRLGESDDTQFKVQVGVSCTLAGDLYKRLLRHQVSVTFEPFSASMLEVTFKKSGLDETARDRGPRLNDRVKILTGPHKDKTGKLVDLEPFKVKLSNGTVVQTDSWYNLED